MVLAASYTGGEICPSRKNGYIHRLPARRQLQRCSGVRFRAISVTNCTEIGPQSTPEAVDEALALKKHTGADLEVEKAF